jgi:hypothetical protein
MSENSGVGFSSAILSTSIIFNAPPNTEIVRISPDGFYVRGVKLEQDETEARRLFDALMAFMSGRGFDKTQVRNDAIEECANLRFNIQPNGYGFNGRARLSWDLALQTYQETIRALVDAGMKMKEWK